MTLNEQIQALAAQGIGRRNAEATIGRAFTPSELADFRRAQTLRQLRIAQKKSRGPMSTAERVRKHVAAANEVPSFDSRPRHPRLKEKCRDNLALFGWMYCRAVLRHRPPAAIVNGLIKSVQEAILNGGQSVKLYGRGTGKTTWIVFIAVVWAILYGHRRYPIVISATGKLARKNLKTIKRILVRSRGILQDFPEVAVALRELNDIAQRAASQTYHGLPTDVEWASDQIRLPTLRDTDGNPLAPACGAIVGSVGIGGAVRGANEAGQRPDFLIFDDPQTRKIAHSPSLVESVIGYIHNDALQLAGHDRRISAFVTITPQCFGDVSTELTSQTRHPEWDVTSEPFISQTPAGWDSLLDEYVSVYIEDAANHDSKFTRSREWYLANRERFADTRVLDHAQYDKRLEVDAIHHMLNLRAALGRDAFDAEIMMRVADRASDLQITPDIVAGACNGAPRGILPPGTDCAVAFCDLNIQRGAGLSWGVCAFGAGRVAAVVAYGRYPATGALVPPNASDLERNRIVAGAIRHIAETVRDLRLRDQFGHAVNVRALAFDRGYLPDVVHRSLYVLRKTLPLPFSLVAMRGFGWNKFGTRQKDMLRRGDHIFATRSQYGEYLAEMAPYWREIMQSGFLETPLMPGSLSFYGKEPTEHFQLAQEVCAEKLVRKYTTERNGKSETAWDWSTNGDNHFCDVLTGCFALASWFRCYAPLSSVLDSAARGISTPKPEPRQIHQDDLFDPRVNPAINDNLNASLLEASEPPKTRSLALLPKTKSLAIPRPRGKYRLAH